MGFLEIDEDVEPWDVLEHHEPKGQRKRDDGATLLVAALADGQWHERDRLGRLPRAVAPGERTFKRAAIELGVESELQGVSGSCVVVSPNWATPFYKRLPNRGKPHE